MMITVRFFGFARYTPFVRYLGLAALAWAIAGGVAVVLRCLLDYKFSRLYREPFRTNWIKLAVAFALGPAMVYFCLSNFYLLWYHGIRRDD
jgi:hypothetical protein